MLIIHCTRLEWRQAEMQLSHQDQSGCDYRTQQQAD